MVRCERIQNGRLCTLSKVMRSSRMSTADLHATFMLSIVVIDVVILHMDSKLVFGGEEVMNCTWREVHRIYIIIGDEMINRW